ncbi:hypothetical protein [Methylotenera sp.]|uniref:hypothetical protein n=1 Tax=Methylotenera sp. TaxID=2051956 RepID=UPI0024871EA4|nr:hypothetical protein [Methylotenera sp.]MDI1298444.1 hypothetical protein [Methylotenera sp.]
MGHNTQMAKQWLKEREAASAEKRQVKNLSLAKIEALAGEAPSCATAQSGARGLQGEQSLFATVAGLHEKTYAWTRLQINPKFRHIADAANDVLHSEVK